MLRLFANDRYCPYATTILMVAILSSLVWFKDMPIPKEQNVSSLANIFITVIAIFVWFLWVSLTLIYQGRNENKNLKMLEANWKYGLLLSYFKHAIVCSMLAICVWIFVSLWIWNNWPTLIALLWINVLVFLMNYRIIRFLFKILEN